MSPRTYSCSVPGCYATYLRKEHLNRHSAQSHQDGNRFSCPHCSSTLARSDLLRRHIKAYHQECELPQFRAQKACSACRARKERCEGKFPCSSCERRGIACSLAPEPETQNAVRVNTQADSVDDELPESPAMDVGSTDTTMDTEDIGATATQLVTQEYVDIYFRDFHPHWPFLHPSTFDASREPSILVQSVVMIGMWITGRPEKRDAALQLHRKLSDAVRIQAESWSVPAISSSQQNIRALWPMATYQSILLQIIMSLFLAKENNTTDLSLRHQLSADDSFLLITLVRTCRALGMFYYPNMVEQHSPTAPLAMIWVNVEEIKRFGLALYKVCRMSSLAVATDTILNPRKELLNLADLDFCIPDSDQVWVNRRENTDHEAWMSSAARVLCDVQVDFEWI
ncbi:C2H2 type zinc finger domain protein [Aspergillus steynii IBT 23096]|uniref:C2H2 type zinc finger domain protein n=1 Tax=Aspergillus steynii IBT 23096 TaxID=1392250 RepID=A0A2I2GI75_9EURO|nr:C2H2 type zinc finger domain protein [Aspergillus steynii IBT 23096]PLB52586.1 C2H2 type zinc finger domain protein [Aspergillus steynii IBT 23096]